MDIYDYWGKDVKITDIDGQIFVGHVAYYTSELDDPDGIANISLRQGDSAGILIGFTTAEIASIEIIDADVHEMAKVV